MIPYEVRQGVLARDGYRCVRCGESVFARQYSLQHRKARGMGGTRTVETAPDLITMCGSGTTGCHGHVEAHPNEAREQGWRVDQAQDTAKVPVRVHRRGHVLLTADYRYEDVAA